MTQKKNRQVEQILLEKILPFVTKPGRYLGNELNTVHKNPEQVSVRVALAFPEVYEIAMSYIGFDILYHVLNKQPHIWAERVYAPWPDMESLMRQNGLALYSLESFTPIREFDIVGFTFQYELTYTNILNMLHLAGIPVLAEQRDQEDPFVIAGGPCTCNPEPMADFIDAFLIGDGEEGVVEMANAIQEGRQAGASRKEILKKLAQIRGVYVPRFYRAEYDQAGWFAGIYPTEPDVPPKILSRVLPELKEEYYPEKPIVPLLSVTHDRLSVEVMRGCTEGCRYCNAGMIYRPTRERPVQEVVHQVERGLQNSGYGEVSFLSLSISDYEPLPELMRESRKNLAGSNVNVSFPSMRLDSFSEEIADFVSEVRKSGFTFAPEAGSERLRQVINKNITEQDLFDSVRIALDYGWKVLKFYFMIGLPTETEEDVTAIADLIEQVARISRPYGKVKFNISISPFSPKAHTPFQWERQDTREELLHKVSLLKKRFSRIRQARLSWRDPEVSLLETVLGRADRRMGKVIYQAWKQGAVFDGWSEYFKPQLWLQVADELDVPFMAFAEAIDPEKPLPWDHIDKGVTKNFLLKERQNAYRQVVKIDCKKGTCYGCGIQRKGSFREFADCYTKLQLHQPVPHEKQAPLSRTTVRPKKTKEMPVQEEAGIKFRGQFEKTGYARFLSHLDLVRIFERACRRAQIPLQYSQGFNPHPKLSFGQPLALGYTSQAEYMDVELKPSFRGDLIGQLNPFLPEGIRLLKMKPIRTKTDSLASVINVSEYLVDLKSLPLTSAEFERALNELLTAEQIEVRRQVKGRQRTINIRPFIQEIHRESDRLRLKTRTIENRTVRVGEIMSYLLRQQLTDERGLQVHRYGQFIRRGDREMTPFDVLP